MQVLKLMNSPQKPPVPHSHTFANRQLPCDSRDERPGIEVSARASTSSAGRPSLGQNLAASLQIIGNRFSNLGKQLDKLRMVAAPQQAQQAPQLYLGGKWRKDKQASDMDGYGKSLDLMGIHGFKKKTAMVLMDGLEISQNESGLKAAFLTKVPQWRPTEVYSFEEPVQMTRRDQRKGQQTAVTTAGDGSVQVDVTWDEPNAGGFKETYRIPEEGVLHIESVTTIGSESASTLQVYRKYD
jgi:hypothetical protein